MKKAFNYFMLVVLLCVIIAVCGCPNNDSNSSGGQRYACSYEKRSSACGGGNYSVWKKECYSFNSSDYTISPQQVCNNVSSNDTHCAAGCCIYVEGRNAVLTAGSCP